MFLCDLNESLSCHIKQALEILFGERGQPSVAHPFYENIVERARDLADAQRTIEEFLRQERNEQQQDRKRKKNGDLE